jgi:hypothetical protein
MTSSKCAAKSGVLLGRSHAGVQVTMQVTVQVNMRVGGAGGAADSACGAVAAALPPHYLARHPDDKIP